MNGEMERLRHVVALALGVDDAEIDPEASMERVEVWDSLRHLYVVMGVEEAFGVKLDDTEAVAVTSIPLLRDALERHGVAFGD